MTLVAPRIVNSVSCVTRINHEIHFSWQAQYLVSLDNDTQIFQSTLVLFDPKKIEVFFSKKLEVFSLKK